MRRAGARDKPAAKNRLVIGKSVSSEAIQNQFAALGLLRFARNDALGRR